MPLYPFTRNTGETTSAIKCLMPLLLSTPELQEAERVVICTKGTSGMICGSILAVLINQARPDKIVDVFPYESSKSGHHGPSSYGCQGGGEFILAIDDFSCGGATLAKLHDFFEDYVSQWSAVILIQGQFHMSGTDEKKLVKDFFNPLYFYYGI